MVYYKLLEIYQYYYSYNSATLPKLVLITRRRYDTCNLSSQSIYIKLF